MPVALPSLYPDQDPLRSLTVPVSGGHCLHVQEWGCANGIAALVLHGGPGSGCTPLLRRYFDPQRFRVVCPDQRGAGRSTPRGSTEHNTTADLLADLRGLRETLGIARWLVVGGSWGAALALAHASYEPDAVTGLLLRSTFLARPQDADDFFRGAPQRLANEWRQLPDMPAARGRVLAQDWWQWERHLAGLPVEVAPIPAQELEAKLAGLRVQAHYLRHGCWLQAPPLLELCAALPRVPTLLLHGAADRVCAPAGAQALHDRLPHSRLHRLPGVGHDAAHPLMVGHMVEALDAFARHGDFNHAGGGLRGWGTADVAGRDWEPAP